MSLFGRDETAHRLLADHLTAEYRVKTMARDRVVDEWKLKAIRPDNPLAGLPGWMRGSGIDGRSQTVRNGSRKGRSAPED